VGAKGLVVGRAVGLAVGRSVGDEVVGGRVVGLVVGRDVGGEVVGAEGMVEGRGVGLKLGSEAGLVMGSCVDAEALGAKVEVGAEVVGVEVGCCVGAEALGAKVEVGAGVVCCKTRVIVPVTISNKAGHESILLRSQSHITTPNLGSSSRMHVFVKRFSPNCITVDRMKIFLMLLSAKAALPIDLTLAGITIVSMLDFANALSPMLST